MATPLDRHRAAVRARLRTSGVVRPDPRSISWRINREVVVVAGWGRAILLQIAHPLIGAAVADHSSFRGSMTSGFARLASTVRAMLSLTFGTDEEAIAAAAGINSIHDRVNGKGYSAHDPELLRWVHATLLDSIPPIYELIVGPLTSEDRDRYCAQASIMEPLLDIPEGLLPRNSGQLDTYMRGMLQSGRIVPSQRSQALARAKIGRASCRERV